MKNNLQANRLPFKMILLVGSFMLLTLYGNSKAAGLRTVSRASSRIAVNFKNNVGKNELTIRVISGTEAVMQLFIFTPDGTLIKEVAVSIHQIATIKGLKRGLYLYECFDNDERMKSGSLKIK